MRFRPAAVAPRRLRGEIAMKADSVLRLGEAHPVSGEGVRPLEVVEDEGCCRDAAATPGGGRRRQQVGRRGHLGSRCALIRLLGAHRIGLGRGRDVPPEAGPELLQRGEDRT